jgi:ribosomal protein S6--L-glutamate ligase
VAQADDLVPLLARAAAGGPAERGILLQELIPCGSRSLRVAVIGRRLISYWRVADCGAFQASLARGGRLDRRGAPRLQKAAREAVASFCHATGVNLAGFDLLFDTRQGKSPPPLMLEINWFFGREGLGGSRRFYGLLRSEIMAWLAARGLTLKTGKKRGPVAAQS